MSRKEQISSNTYLVSIFLVAVRSTQRIGIRHVWNWDAGNKIYITSTHIKRFINFLCEEYYIDLQCKNWIEKRKAGKSHKASHALSYIFAGRIQNTFTRYCLIQRKQIFHNRTKDTSVKVVDRLLWGLGIYYQVIFDDCILLCVPS